LGEEWEAASLIDRWCWVPRPRKPMDGLRFKTARQAETEAAPSQYVAELLDIDTMPSGNFGLIALMCDPLAIALTPRPRRGD
jgi:hypothetical protein